MFKNMFKLTNTGLMDFEMSEIKKQNKTFI